MLFKWEFSLYKKTVTTNRSIEQRLVPAKSKIPSYTGYTDLKGHFHGHFLAFLVKRHQNYDEVLSQPCRKSPRT